MVVVDPSSLLVKISAPTDCPGEVFGEICKRVDIQIQICAVERRSESWTADVCESIFKVLREIADSGNEPKSISAIEVFYLCKVAFYLGVIRIAEKGVPNTAADVGMNVRADNFGVRVKDVMKAEPLRFTAQKASACWIEVIGIEPDSKIAKRGTRIPVFGLNACLWADANLGESIINIVVKIVVEPESVRLVMVLA